MKNRISFLTLTSMMFLFFGVTFAQDQGKVKLKNKLDTISYIIGYDIGNNLKGQSIDINTQIFSMGIEDAITAGKSAISEADKVRIMNTFQQEMTKKMQDSKKGHLDENKRLGKEFLEANKKKKGIIVTASGLQYEVLKEGTGKSPKVSDQVTVNYLGKLLDGKTFDSSYDRGKPATFMLSGVIPGWTEGLQLMKEGAKYRFYIPSDLAYGENGMENTIPPGATLIFEVELISVQTK